MAVKKSDDFDTSELVKVQAHTELTARVSALEEAVGSDKKLAASLKKSFAESNTLRAELARTFKVLLKSDDEVKGTVLELINSSDRGYFYKFIKRIGFFAWSCLVGAMGIIGGILIKKYFS